MATLPTAKEINVFNSLDERTACEHFLGKTLDEAELLLRENVLFYQGDLLWMGPVAFRFYVAAYLHFLESEFACGSSDGINGFIGLLEFRLKYEPHEIALISDQLENACHRFPQQIGKFDFDPAIYGNLPNRLTAVCNHLRAISAK